MNAAIPLNADQNTNKKPLPNVFKKKKFTITYNVVSNPNIL